MKEMNPNLIQNQNQNLYCYSRHSINYTEGLTQIKQSAVLQLLLLLHIVSPLYSSLSVHLHHTSHDLLLLLITPETVRHVMFSNSSLNTQQRERDSNS